jgi:hypothetical protein
MTQWTDPEDRDIMVARGRNLYYLSTRPYRKVLEPKNTSSYIAKLHGSEAARLMELRHGIPPGYGCLPVSGECRVLSGRDVCDGLIPCPEESYRVCVCVCVIESDHVQQ